MSRLNFDLDVLRSFVLGIELGSFARAADRLGRSASAVSMQLKKLEEQVGQPVLRKAGRQLALTPAGETLFAYARRLLDLNDEAAAAVRGAGLQGSVRLGLQEDFGERLLTEALGRFARAHPGVRIEVRIARQAELLDAVAAGRLDLALAWDGERQTPHTPQTPYCRHIADIPACWIGRAGVPPPAGEPLPLVAFEAPCLMRSAATRALDDAGRAWRIALTSPSLAGIWAAVEAGLGLAVRTVLGLPDGLAVVPGLPALPRIGLGLHRAEATPPAAVGELQDIVLARLDELLRPHGLAVAPP